MRQFFVCNVSLYCHDGIGNFIPFISLSQFNLLCGGGFIGLNYYQSLLLLLLLFTALTDFKTDCIPNAFVEFGIVIGAPDALLKLLSEYNGRERMYYFLSYMSKVARTRQRKICGVHTV